MRVSLKTLMPALFCGTLSLTACETVYDRAEKYLSETNHSQKDLNRIKAEHNNMKCQSMLDSIAYRDIFNSTAATKDSAKVAEFNKIAAKMRMEKESDDWNRFSMINEKLAEEGISVKDLKKIDDTDSQMDGDLIRLNRRQHFADDWAYRKFFEKIGIMNDDVAKKCDEISQKVRPKD